MKVAAITPVYNDEEIIGGALRCFRPFVDQHIALISTKPYYGEVEPPDRTEEICREMDCDILKMDWRKDHEQRNRGLELLKDYDWILNIDADELMEAKEIERLFEQASNTDADAIGVFPEVYWGDIDHVLRPLPTFEPVIMTRPKVRFTEVRCIDHPYALSDVSMHHIAWCRPKNILKKVLTYVHAGDGFDGKKWYEEQFLNWREGMDAIDPFGNKFGTIRKELPKELRDKLGVG